MPLPRVAGVRGSEPPAARSWTLREYPSPDGSRTLRFTDAAEYAMGSTFWSVALAGAGRAKRLPRAVELRFLEPWSPDGRRFAYVELGKAAAHEHPVLVMGVEGAARRHAPPREHASAVLWSPARPLLLVVGSREAVLLDAAGERTCTVAWPSIHFEEPFAGWLPSGGSWFSMHPRAPDEPHAIRFYSSEGREIGRDELDPDESVPYDASAYRAIPRERWALAIGPGTMGAGMLLDRWSDARYEPRSGRLELCVYRPTGPVQEHEDVGGRMLAAPARARWIEVTLEG